MSNQAEVDYDKQFQDDLAKATALSLEQQALDDYRRHKKYGTNYQSYSGQNQAQRSHSLSQRRHSEVHQVASPVSHLERSRTPPAQTPENDLISFASPTGKQPEGGTPFGKLIEDLQRQQTQTLVPVGPVAAAAAQGHYGFVQPSPQPQLPYGAAGAVGGMQLVPYQPQQQTQQRPLNQEELQRLYSLPNHQMAVQPAMPANAFLYYPGAVVTPYTAPIVPGSAAFMPPQYPSHGFGVYGQHMGSTHVDFSRPASSPATNNMTNMSPSNQQQQQQQQQPLATTASSVEANGFSLKPRRVLPSSSGSFSSGPMPTPRRTGNDLIDLNQDDYSRVSVLEAFDPLLNENIVSQK